MKLATFAAATLVSAASLFSASAYAQSLMEMSTVANSNSNMMSESQVAAATTAPTVMPGLQDGVAPSSSLGAADGLMVQGSQGEVTEVPRKAMGDALPLMR